MSMKVYNGFLVSLIRDDDLFRRIDELRETLTPVYEYLYLDTLARLSVAIFNEPPSDPKLSPVSHSHLRMAEAVIEITRTGIRNPSFDFGFEICFLDHPDSDSEALAIAYCEKDEYLNAIRDMACFEPWPYWNNVDQPDGIHDDDWDYRRDVWSEALGYSAPATRGLTWSLRGTYDPPPSYHSPLFAERVAEASGSAITVEQLLTPFGQTSEGGSA